MRRTVLLTVMAAFGLAACGGDPVVERSEVEKQTRAGLTKFAGREAPPVTCPEELEAKVGATTRCRTDFPDGNRLGITVKVTSVKDERVNFDIKADEKLTKTPKGE